MNFNSLAAVNINQNTNSFSSESAEGDAEEIPAETPGEREEAAGGETGCEDS